MRKTFGMNKHQKAAHKVGEEKVGRAEIGELLTMSCSTDTDERLTAATYLCPCHIQARIPAVWEAIFRLMEDDDPRVRQAAWHTWEDGGLPTEAEALTHMEQIYQRERDSKVRKFAEFLLRDTRAARARQERTWLHLAARPNPQRGKCDFCGAQEVPVVRALDTAIPTAGAARAAWICERCAKES